MAKNKNLDSRGFVYSTDPNFSFEPIEEKQTLTLEPEKQKLRIKIDTKNRGGKTATIIENFMGNEEGLDTLGKSLKNHCGTGGAVKDGLIIIQGDQRDKILAWLLKNGYKLTKKI